MKTKTIRTISIIALGTLLVLPNHSAAQTKPSSAVSLADLKNQFTLLQTEVSATVASLNAVKASAKSPADLGKAAADLARTFEALQSRVNTLQSNAVTIKARVKDHYEAWAKQLTMMENPNLREKAQERLTDSQKNFDKIVARASDAKEKVLPFVSSVKDIVIYLGVDQSADAVASMSNDIWKLDKRSSSVNGSIEDVVKQIDKTMKALPQK